MFNETYGISNCSLSSLKFPSLVWSQIWVSSPCCHFTASMIRMASSSPRLFDPGREIFEAGPSWWLFEETGITLDATTTAQRQLSRQCQWCWCCIHWLFEYIRINVRDYIRGKYLKMTFSWYSKWKKAEVFKRTGCECSWHGIKTSTLAQIWQGLSHILVENSKY